MHKRILILRAPMKSILIFTAASTLCVAASGQTWVDGHYRKNGTYVEGHMRSAPNQTRYDNFSAESSVYGNNPYTGKRGSQRDEFSAEPRYNSSYGQEPRRQCSRDVFGNRICE